MIENSSSSKLMVAGCGVDGSAHRNHPPVAMLVLRYDFRLILTTLTPAERAASWRWSGVAEIGKFGRYARIEGGGRGFGMVALTWWLLMVTPLALTWSLTSLLLNITSILFAVLTLVSL